MKRKSDFLKVYSNLPIDIRKEIILVIQEKDNDIPITWNVAFNEILNETQLGQKILEKIIEMDLI